MSVALSTGQEVFRQEPSGRLAPAQFRVFLADGTSGAETCSPGCKVSQAVDDTCQDACNVATCDFDSGACFDWPPLQPPFDKTDNFIPIGTILSPNLESALFSAYNLGLPFFSFKNNTKYYLTFTTVTSFGPSRLTTFVAQTGIPSIPGPPIFWQDESTKNGGTLIFMTSVVL